MANEFGFSEKPKKEAKHIFQKREACDAEAFLDSSYVYVLQS